MKIHTDSGLARIEYLRLPTRRTNLVGNRQRERLGLLAMCLIAKRHFEGTPAPSADLLVSELNQTRIRALQDFMPQALAEYGKNR
jgi:hypothetical protein